jgi:DNA-binding MarR family transcriptional regulator
MAEGSPPRTPTPLRRSNEQDQRVVELRPTARGLRLWKTLKHRVHEAVLGLTKDLPKENLQVMVQILEDLTTRLERW